MTRLLAVCLLLAAVSLQGAVLNEENNSRPRPNNSSGGDVSRIIGGSDVVDIKDRNFQVSIFMDNEYFCGGSLIRNDVVLTAAHCTQGRSEFEVHLGSVQLGVPLTSVITRTKIEHEDYDPDTHENDIAILMLETKVDLGDDINVVDLASDMTGSNTAEKGTVSGWGITSPDNPSLPLKLQTADLVVASNGDCKPRLKLPDGQFCVIIDVEKQPCIGDSGGPLTYTASIGVKKTTLTGIASYMTTADCGNPEVSPVFTRVSYYKTWIEENW